MFLTHINIITIEWIIRVKRIIQFTLPHMLLKLLNALPVGSVQINLFSIMVLLAFFCIGLSELLFDYFNKFVLLIFDVFSLASWDKLSEFLSNSGMSLFSALGQFAHLCQDLWLSIPFLFIWVSLLHLFSILISELQFIIIITP